MTLDELKQEEYEDALMEERKEQLFYKDYDYMLRDSNYGKVVEGLKDLKEFVESYDWDWDIVLEDLLEEL